MKSLISLLVALSLVFANVASLPAHGASFNHPVFEKTFDKRQDQGTGALPLTPPPFNATAQYVSNQGAHAFIAPGPNDQRGPCPGLNAMANHGYLPRNGIATTQQFIDATNTVFGMSRDLGGFLSLYGSIVDGDGSGWSIAGVPHTGISGSHNNYETDSSPLKGDLNQYGSNGRVIMSQFFNLYNRQPDANTANYNLEVLRSFRGDRFRESVSKNPYFVYGPFTGIAVSQAAFTFIYRFMSNKSASNPEGLLNKAVLKSFMSITGPENNLTWVPGNERIPDNWYKRNPAAEYTIPYFIADSSYFAQTEPEIDSVGCNQGKVNTYNTITPETLSGGVYTSQQVAKNPYCFITAFTVIEAASAGGLNSSQVSALNNGFTTIAKSLGYDCQAITNANSSALTACPGFSFYGGPTGQVANGAIQS